MNIELQELVNLLSIYLAKNNLEDDFESFLENQGVASSDVFGD